MGGCKGYSRVDHLDDRANRRKQCCINDQFNIEMKKKVNYENRNWKVIALRITCKK